MKKIVYVSGPSGMAKTSVMQKLACLGAPLGFRFERAIVATSRDMRPGESPGNPWYFKSIAEINADHAKNPERFLAVEVRKGEMQGLDAETELKNKLQKAGVLWCELHMRWFAAVQGWLTRHMPDVAVTRVFMAPLTEAEVAVRAEQGNSGWEKVIEAEVLRRLLARCAANLDNAPLEKLQQRAHDAVGLYAARGDYDCVIVNHQGEESAEWGAGAEFPTGEAARVFEQFLRIYLA